MTDDDQRPKTRGDCVDGIRPCPYVACRHNLRLIRGPELEDGGRASCALDVAEDGGWTREEVGECLNMDEGEVRSIEESALVKIRNALGISLASKS